MTRKQGRQSKGAQHRSGQCACEIRMGSARGGGIMRRTVKGKEKEGKREQEAMQFEIGIKEC